MPDCITCGRSVPAFGAQCLDCRLLSARAELDNACPRCGADTDGHGNCMADDPCTDYVDQD